MLTGGSGEAISMVIQALTDPGDTVLTEEFLYLGTLRSLRRYKANVVGIKCDEDGIIPEDLDAAIQRLKGEGRKVKYLYTIPTFQNPLGWTMTLERRKKVLEVTRQHGVPVFEDDCYIDLRFEGEDVASFHSLDDTGQVIYVGSFSKTIAPGMRMGYLVAPPEVTSRAWAFKMGGAVNHFAALTIAEYMNHGDLEGHVREQNDTLRAKRDAMLASLGENFGDAAAWTKPEGGLYVWLTLPEGDRPRLHSGAGVPGGGRLLFRRAVLTGGPRPQLSPPLFRLPHAGGELRGRGRTGPHPGAPRGYRVVQTGTTNTSVQHDRGLFRGPRRETNKTT